MESAHHERHENARLEALCDGVFAIAMTLLIIDVGIPATANITTTAEFWHALLKITPQIYAFILSFIVIFIDWVNHHNFLKLVERSSPPFIYANGLFLLAIVMIPFPTNLLGEYVLTNHAAPAVVLYNVVFALGAVGWVLMGRTAAAGHLGGNEVAERRVAQMTRDAAFGLVVYSLLAALAFWLPLLAAALTTLLALYWLVYGAGFVRKMA